MKELSVNQMEATKGGKFWGNGSCTPMDGTQYIYEHNGGAWDCTMKWSCKKYAFWISYGQDEVNGGCVW